jgi:hypothetical protein
MTGFDQFGAPRRELVPAEIDQHRAAWLTTEDGRGYATLRRVRFAIDGGIYTLLPRDSVVLRQIPGRRGCDKSLGKGRQRMTGPETRGWLLFRRRVKTSWARHSMARKYWLLGIAFWMEPARGLGGDDA